FLPQPIAMFAGAFMAVTQAWLVISGNFSWLNVTTILLCASTLAVPHEAMTSPFAYDVTVGAVATVLGVLSIRPALNLVSPNQRMNASFDPLHLVNTYGAFGSITKVRHEVV